MKLAIAKLVPNVVSRHVARTILKTQKQSPTILMVGGTVGFVATVVLASRATLRVHEIIEETKTTSNLMEKRLTDPKDSYSQQDADHDKVYLYVRMGVDITTLYLPTILVGSAAIACFTGSHIILSRRNAALTAAYTTLDRAFKEYRQRVVDHFGKSADDAFRHGYTYKDVMSENEGGEPVVERQMVNNTKIPSMYARFFDDTCSAWQRHPEYNRMFLNSQQNMLNDRLHSRGHVFLNEVYDALGMPRSRAGSVVGWIDGEGDSYIDFGIFNETNSSLRDFVNGYEGSVLIDPNVDGVIWDKI